MAEFTRYGTKRYGVGPYVRSVVFEQAPNVVGNWTKQIDTTQEIWSKQPDTTLEEWTAKSKDN